MDNYQNNKDLLKSILRFLFSEDYVSGIIVTIFVTVFIVVFIVVDWDTPSPRHPFIKLFDGIENAQKRQDKIRRDIILHSRMTPNRMNKEKEILHVPELPKISDPQINDSIISIDVSKYSITNPTSAATKRIYPKNISQGIDELKKDIEETTKKGHEWNTKSNRGSKH